MAFGTTLVVKATLAIGERHGWSEVFLGLTVLAIGTDLPELVVAIDGALFQLRGMDASGIVVGNAIGSAIAQGGLVLGVCGLLSAIDLSEHHVQRDGIVLLGSIALLALFAGDGVVTRVEGAALVAVYTTYLVALIYRARAGARVPRDAVGRNGPDVLRVLGGLLVLLLSAEVVVQQALSIAAAWGVSTTLVGVVLVAVGTSLPELSLSLRAILEDRPGLSVGNILGSNIFDLLIPVGVGASIVPLAVAWDTLWMDLPALLVLSVLLLGWALRRSPRHRLHAALLLGVYVLYLTLRILLETEPPPAV